MLSQDYDFVFKILIIGKSAVGKSNVLLRFSDNVFQQSFLPTIGVDFKIRTVQQNNTVIKLQMWDTAGQEKFKTITAAYYKGAHGIIVMYDITDRESFSDLQNWLMEVQKYAPEKVKKILVGNKSDLRNERQVSYEEGRSFAAATGMQFLEVSAKENTNVEQTFMNLTDSMLKSIERRPGNPDNSQRVKHSEKNNDFKIKRTKPLQRGFFAQMFDCLKLGF